MRPVMDGNGNIVNPEAFWAMYNQIHPPGGKGGPSWPPSAPPPGTTMGQHTVSGQPHPLVLQQLFGGGAIKGGPTPPMGGGMMPGLGPGARPNPMNRPVDVNGDGTFDMTLAQLIERMKGLHSQAQDPNDASAAAQVFAQLQKLGAERHKQRQQAMNVPAQYRAMSRGG